MLKKLLLLGVILSASLFGLSSEATKTAPSRLELKAGYFLFENSKMRDVYSNGGFQIQLSGSSPIKNQLQIYGSTGFRELFGHSLHFHEKSTFWEIFVDVGLKPIFKIREWVDWYFAFGPRYFYLHQKNESNYVNKIVAKNGIGLFCNTGFDFLFTKNYFINVFAEYSYEPISISGKKQNTIGRNIQVGGFDFGLGFGYSF